METSLFDLKIVYSYVIEIPDSESEFGFYNKGLVSEIIAFYHFQNNALSRPGRRCYVPLPGTWVHCT